MLNEFYMNVNGKEYRYIVVDFLPDEPVYDENGEAISNEDCYQCLVEDVEKDVILPNSEYVYISQMKEAYDFTYEN